MFDPTRLGAICCLLLLFACQRGSEKNTANTLTTVQVPADFQAFYDKFHSDSLYQINHISWPLAGRDTDKSTISETPAFWERNEWRMMRGDKINSGEYDREVAVLEEFLIVERIKAKAVNYGLERRFAKTGGEWQLIFYSDIFEFK